MSGRSFLRRRATRSRPCARQSRPVWRHLRWRKVRRVHSPMQLRPVQHTYLCRCAVANGKMQFENVAREWRCKWKDDGGGNAVCETPVPRERMASCSPRQCQEQPRAAARLGQADLIGLLTARWNPRLHVQKMTCTCHVTCTCTCNMHMHMHMHAHDMHICRQG